jgi:hypothetical protein
MSAAPSSSHQARRSGTAFRRRLGERDVRELAGLAAALKIAGATSFERCGVKVHLVHHSQLLAQERPHGDQAQPEGAGDGAHGNPAREGVRRTPRQQKRFERGQERAKQRSKQGRGTLSAPDLGSANQPRSEERAEGAFGRRTESNAAFSGAVQAVTTTAAADAASAGNASQSVQQQLSKADKLSLVPRAVQLKQQQMLDQAVGKRGSPATPTKQTAVAAQSSPDSAQRPGPKRRMVPVRDASGAPSQKTGRARQCLADPHVESSKEVVMVSVESSSDSEPNSDSEDDSPDIRTLKTALHAARNGSEPAMDFLMTMRMQGRLPPDLAASWDRMVAEHS